MFRFQLFYFSRYISNSSFIFYSPLQFYCSSSSNNNKMFKESITTVNLLTENINTYEEDQSHESKSKPNKIPKEPIKKEIHTKLDKELEIREKFIKGWGKGGQKVNKTNNAVFLHEVKYDIKVKCHETRSREQNRKIARKILDEKIIEAEKQELSKTQKKILKIQKRKSKKRVRAKMKYSDKLRGDAIY